MIEVTRVDYVRVPVDDIEQAARFYGEVLGLPRNEHLDHDDWVEFEASNVTLAVMTPATHDYECAPLPPSGPIDRSSSRPCCSPQKTMRLPSGVHSTGTAKRSRGSSRTT